MMMENVQRRLNRQVMKELKNNNIKDLLKQYNDLVKEKQEIQAAIDADK